MTIGKQAIKKMSTKNCQRRLIKNRMADGSAGIVSVPFNSILLPLSHQSLGTQPENEKEKDDRDQIL